jgi:hypothetical protein
MSDQLTLAEPASTEPTTTASIIENAIADLPDDGGSDDLGAHAVDGDDAPARPATTSTTAEPAPTAAEIDELAQALGIAGAGKAKWTQRVAYSKVAKIVKEREQKARETHEAALRQHEGRLREVEAVERMIAEQPEQFVRALVAQNPAYRQYFHDVAATSQPQPARDVPRDMPAPDVQLADGTRTYSVDGLQRLLTWNTQQAEQRIAQRLQPIEHERQQRELIAAAVPRVKQQIAEAEKWPLFAESKAEILALLQSDPRIDLTGAYQRIVIPKLAANRDQVRQDVLRELNTRPHSTSVTRTASSRVEDTQPRNTRDIIAAAIAGLND